MPYELVVKHCSPTLAGLKTGNMFTCSYDDKKSLLCDICVLNKLLGKKGLRVIPLKFSEDKALIYVFRPDKLDSDLRSPEAEIVLKKIGYSCKSTGSCINDLKKRLLSCKDFPHEIGLFLGYPPDDVRSFMESPCRGVKCVGCWKAYSNQEEAEKTFKRFQKCTEIYKKEVGKGKSLEDLIVVEPVNER